MKVSTPKTLTGIAAGLMLGLGVGTSAPAQASIEPFLGEISMFGFNFTPRGWAACDGQLLAISQNTALFALLGTMYGGDGRTTFALPDLRGRVPLHTGGGPGLTPLQQGQRGGSETVTLSEANLPAHSHAFALPASSGRGTTSNPANAVPANDPRERQYSTNPPDVEMRAGQSASAGGGQSFSVRDPYLVVRFGIALQGIFPSRN